MKTIALWTRMYSSRMRTGRMLTVFRCLVPGGGGGCIPKESRNQKKIPPPQKNWGCHPNTPNPPPPRKMETPWRNGDPPEKLETPLDQNNPRTRPHPPPGLTCKACWDTQHPPPGTHLQGMLGYPAPPLDRHTLVKILYYRPLINVCADDWTVERAIIASNAARCSRMIVVI